MTKNRYIKFKNLLVSSKLWDISFDIKVHICQETHSVAFLAYVIEVLLDCDQRLPFNGLIYFENCVIIFDQVLTKSTKDFNCFVDCKMIKSNIYVWRLTLPL